MKRKTGLCMSLIKNSNKKINLYDFLMVVLVAYYMLYKMPVVSYYVNTYITMILLIGLSITIFLRRGKKGFSLSAISMSIIPSLVMFFIDYLYAKSFSIEYASWSFFLFVLPMILGFYVVNNTEMHLDRGIVFFTFVVYFITVATTIVGLLKYPDASRLLATDASEKYIPIYSPLNIGGYNFIYSLVLVHPLVVAALRKRKRTLFAVIFSLASLICVIQSAYTIALLVFLLSLTSYVLPVSQTKKVKRANRFIIVLVVLLIIVLMINAVQILDALATWDALDEKVAQKISDISSILQGENVSGEGTESRQIRYQTSIDAFLENPLFGSRWLGISNDGGHSFFLDTLARWGIVGLLFVLMLWFFIIGKYRKIIQGGQAKSFCVLFVVMAVLLSSLNPTFWVFEMGFIAPVFFKYISDRGAFESN